MGERTGWRDPDLRPWHIAHGFDYPKDEDMEMSARHRKWGHVYGVDIDWPYVEYDYGIVLALVDYALREGLRDKEDGKLDKYRNFNNKALINLADRADVPYYINFYIKCPWAFRVFPMNDKAEQLAPKKQMLTELEYVTWLHELRKKCVSECLARSLDNRLQWEALLPSPRKSKKSRDKSPYTLFNQHPIVQQALVPEEPYVEDAEPLLACEMGIEQAERILLQREQEEWEAIV